MKIALATPHFPKSIADGLDKVQQLAAEAAKQGAVIVCFPETFIPGYPLIEADVPKPSKAELSEALSKVCAIAKANNIAIIIPMDWYEGNQFYNVAQVISAEGEVLGYQTKNQLDPSEDQQWQPGNQRHLFELGGVKFGITICHEGFRYPESVRWAAREGAHVVFHPHLSGSDVKGKQIIEWCSPGSPYYEKAMMMRALENTIYFASVGYAMKYQESTSAIIAPDGECLAYQPYGQEGVIVTEIELEKATGFLGKRFKADLYQ
ncbi:carbon-nitrogen hydrolase family protein [Mucilaginibacter achroorhodeus]|uniref:Carbon-nitrogen hydrolase family protein n=1 Tax=Mucilaginibacter achroorhodeus TaxID=2599294 RepID=A0A563TZ90_9SPHI|nr:carbon-nitrogen hydrolase family protein [Mucilaginibacter achroorhodeus]TWR24685.1 carbon-nitrogen hydrolase family protein [Mucilaginibacter achroorhodeus]